MKRIVFFLMALVLSFAVSAQIKLKLKVCDFEKTPLPGASIIMKSSNEEYFSDKNGELVLLLNQKGLQEFRVSFLGYKTFIQNLEIKSDTLIVFVMDATSILTDEIIVKATRAGNQDPFAYSNIEKKQIEQKQSSRDIPYLLNQTTSLVYSSDAGTGVGYTSLRLRGSDITRINVSINGVPLNDAESQGVWWVNMPDFAKSVSSVQIQRGVGTSTNGAGAFGGSINFQTNELNRKPFAEINSEYGTFQTFRNNITFSTGLMNNHFVFDGRLSKISTKGFVDRASADLESYYATAAYYADKTMIRAIHFGGHETTYQAWNGVPKVRLQSDTDGMMRYMEHYLYTPEQTAQMLESDARTYNFYTYDNEIDNYWQKHTHFILSHQFTPRLNLNAVAHYTHGKGYYEQYRSQDQFSNYGLPDLASASGFITHSDMIRQKWLDNHFYGITFNTEYQGSEISYIFGGAWNQYLGNHFGEIIWAEYATNVPKDYEWYRNRGIKTDFNLFFKTNYQFNKHLNMYADIQFRAIGYKIYGLHDDLRTLATDTIYRFLNPKAGFFYRLNKHFSFYSSFALAHREPSRNEFRDAEGHDIPLPESLFDYEMGAKFQSAKMSLELNAYYMYYRNQLIQTGELNNVGNAIMTNIPESFRKGIELSVGFELPAGFTLNANTTISSNKALKFTAYTDNWDYWNNPETEEYQKTAFFEKSTLIFSPSLISSGSLSYSAPKWLNIVWDAKYVSRQFIDNTNSFERSIEPYFVNDLHIIFRFPPSILRHINLKLGIFNVFNVEYETNAWVYRYFYKGQFYDMDGYFPQAGRHYSLSLSIRI